MFIRGLFYIIRFNVDLNTIQILQYLQFVKLKNLNQKITYSQTKHTIQKLLEKCINEEAKAIDQIPIKKRAKKKGHYRLNSQTIFRKTIYSKRNNVESVISVIKRLFQGTNHSRSLKLSNKETKLKNTIYNIYQTTQKEGGTRTH